MNRHRNRSEAFRNAGAAALLLTLFAGFLPGDEGDYFYRVNKSIDLYGRVYKEIAANYVDRVDPEAFMEAGIDGMLSSLDPYTTYIDRDEGSEVDLVTSGRYGGVGITIGARDGAIEVISVMDGYSAQRQGVRPGDRLMEVNGTPVSSRTPDEVRNLTRGEPGTEVRVTVSREGAPNPVEFVLIREEVQIKDVTYAGFLDEGIAYVRLERFSRKAGEELRQALKDLKIRGDVKGVVLDLRGNPGGLLDAAVEVTGKFVPRGSLVVTTRGRRSESERTYLTTDEPLLPSVPLAVLTDRGSASASEIVAGALQDLDRGVIVGARTFGKGLVQTVLPLNYGAQLKVTTARYYTPSGRSIQVVDYSSKDGAGVIPPPADSTRREYRTARGRAMAEHGGITPDSVVKDTDPGPMVAELRRKAMVFRFANRFGAEHGGNYAVPVDAAVMADFRRFLQDEKFVYHEASTDVIADLGSTARELHYSKAVLDDLDRLKADLALEKDRGFERYADHIRRDIEMEFASRAKGESGRIEASLRGDRQLEVALAFLRTPSLYRRVLQR
jgi:carboxyl-terminal processing protease